MSKSVITILSLLVVTSLFSCKKDHTCKCTVSFSFLGTQVAGDSTYVIPKSTKKNAKKTCNDTQNELQSEVSLVGGTATCGLN